MQSAVEWETDRVRFLGRGRGTDDPIALDGRPLSGTVGATLDPILSLRQRIRLAPGAFARLSFATGIASDRDAAVALCMKYADPTSASRTFALAATQLSISLRHLGIPIEEAQVYERLASRVFGPDRSLGPNAEMLARIDERTQEAERRAELKAIAERLNPDAWVTDADVLAGLDSYETSFEALRTVVGRRRRRPRRDEDPAEYVLV